MTNPYGLHRSDVDDGFWTSCVDARIPATFPGGGEEIASLDLEVARTKTAVILAKKRRNMRVPCSRLPPECLQRIFMLVRDVWPPSRNYDDSAKNQYASGWTAITHVCSAWREFALSTPSLWADLKCTELHLGFMNELIRRSQLVPLHLRIDVGEKDELAVLSLWLRGAHTQRTVSLTVVSRGRDSDGRTLELVSCLSWSEWPSLKHFELIFHHVSPTGHPLAQPFSVEEQQPRLTSLKLMCCMFIWPSNIPFSHIQDLRLALPGQYSSYEIIAGRVLPTAQQLRDMLVAMRAPRIIELTDVFPLDGTFSDEVILPDTLQRLLLCAKRVTQARPCAQVWSQLVIPPGGTNIIISIRHATTEIVDVLRETFASARSGFQSLHPVEIVIGHRSLLLLGSETLCQPDPTPIIDLAKKIQDGLAPRETRLNDEPDAMFSLHHSPIRIIPTFVPLINMGTARVLHFSPHVLEDNLPKSHWLEVFSRAQSVQRVVLPLVSGSKPLLYALAQTDEDKNGNTIKTSRSFIICPRLRSLTLHFRDEKDVRDAQLSEIVGVIIYLIHTRREFGTPLQSIQVSGSMRGSPAWHPIANEIPIIWF